MGGAVPPFASTTEVVSISFDNGANILSSSAGISLVSGTITPTSTLAFSYLKAADSLVIGGIAATVTTSDTASTDFAATLSTVSGTPGITAFSYSTGTGTSFSALTTGVSFVQGIPTPEPASLAIMGSALAGLMLSRRQRRAK